ncbi:hypothetical protein ACFQU7_16060 [Pseudoroseomonas wenyumeiae]
MTTTPQGSAAPGSADHATTMAAIRAMRRQGASLAQIAYALRETGASAPGGGAWTTKVIARVLKKAGS